MRPLQWLALSSLTLGALSLWSVGWSKRPTFTPAPHALGSVTQVVIDGAEWVKRDPVHRYTATVDASDGSMAPVIGERSLLLCVRYTGKTVLRNGSVVIYDRGDKPRVCHTVAEQTDTHVYMSGYVNRRSDGWYPKSRIEGVVVGQLYLP